MISAEFLLTALVVVVMPGTGVIYTVSTGLFRGGRASMAAAIGCTGGIVPHLLASILGLSAILHMSALAFQIVKFAGAGYLLFLAWSMWRQSGGPTFNGHAPRSGLRRIAAKGLLINILNPKLSIFFLAFLPLFVAPDTAAPVVQMVFLGAVFMVMTLVVFVLYGIFANGVRAHVINSPRIIGWLQRSFAVAFAGLGVKLAMTEQ